MPYLLELKKSSYVLFAGIDRPNDVVNFTHHELFAYGGFIVFDELALDTLTLGTVKHYSMLLQKICLISEGELCIIKVSLCVRCQIYLKTT